MHRHVEQLATVLFYTGVVLAGAAQTGPSVTPGQPEAVFILGFGEPVSYGSATSKSLNEFVPSLLEWRLRADDHVSVKRVPSLGCDRSSNTSSNVQNIGSFDDVYYRIQGGVTPELPGAGANEPKSHAEAEMVLTYELSRVSHCQPEVLLRRSVPVTAKNALDSANLMADLIASRIEDAAKTHISTPNVGESDSILEARVDQLLCHGSYAQGPCTSKSRDAIPLLEELVKRHPSNPGLITELGDAQTGDGRYLEAAKSFDTASTLLSSGPAQQHWQLLEKSGDAQSQLRDYGRAADRYKSALDVLTEPSGAQIEQAQRIRLKLARSLRFEGDRTGAFKLLVGLRLDQNAGSWSSEARDLVVSMKPAELKLAEQQINSPEGQESDVNVQAIVYNRLAEQEIDNIPNDAKGKVAHLQAADLELSKAEALRNRSLEKGISSQIFWSRGRWWIYKGQLSNAAAQIDKAVQEDDDPYMKYSAAVFYYSWASEVGQTDQGRPRLWQSASNMAEQILEQSDSRTSAQLTGFADTIFRNANHALGKDMYIKTVYEKLVREQPNSLTIRVGLMGVYTDFLHDSDAALRTARDTYSLADTQRQPTTLLDIAEVYVVYAKSESELFDAQTIIQKLNPVWTDSELDYNAVGSFYLAWSALATHNHAAAVQAEKDWYAKMARFRAGARPLTFHWRFDGASAAIKNANLPEADSSMLNLMIGAMSDLSISLPQVS